MKAKRTYAAVLAAIMAVGSTAVCASAVDEYKTTTISSVTVNGDNGSVKFPTDEKSLDRTEFTTEMGVAVAHNEKDTVTVMFDKSYELVQATLKDKGFTGNMNALWLCIGTNIPTDVTGSTGTTPADEKFIFTDGYGMDSDVDPNVDCDANIKDGYIKLWLNPSNTDKVIKYKVGKGDEQTLTIKYVYATENKVTKAEFYTPSTATVAVKDKIDKFLADTGAKVTKGDDGKTVTVSFTKSKADVDKALTAAKLSGVKALNLSLTTDIDTAYTDGGITAASGAFSFVTTDRDYDKGVIKVSIDPTAAGSASDTKIEFKVGNAAKQTFIIKCAYSYAETDKEVKVEADTGVVPEDAMLTVTKQADVEDASTNTATYDIKFIKGDKEVKPAEGSELTVTLPVPNFAKDDKTKDALKVYYHDTKGTADVRDDSYVDMGAKLNKDKTEIVFTTTHFSEYIITTEDLSSAYDIKYGKVENGTVKVTPETAKEGADVTVDVKADKGYEIDKVTYTVDGKATEITAKDGKYTFKMPKGSVTVSATFKKTATTDPDDKPVNPDDDKKPTNPDDKPANPDDNKPTNPDDNKPGDNKPGATEDDNKDDNKGDNNGTDQKPTGIALAIAPVVLAGACAVVLAKKR